MSTKQCIIPREYWCNCEPPFILMAEGVYSGIRKRVVPRESLTEQECLAIWNSGWSNEDNRHKILCGFGGKEFFALVRKKVFYAENKG